MSAITRTLLAEGWAGAVKTVLALLLLAAGVWQFGSGLYIVAKAEVAQVLLENSWVQTKQTGKDHKPWPWADTWPVAKITVPDLNESVIVLDKVSGQALAFGPGLMPGLSNPGEAGTALIAAHNDTHFAFLKDLKIGQKFELETRHRGTLIFHVTGFEVVDTREKLLIQNPDAPHLVLSTCYPFDALVSDTPYRYLVYAALALN